MSVREKKRESLKKEFKGGGEKISEKSSAPPLLCRGLVKFCFFNRKRFVFSIFPVPLGIGEFCLKSFPQLKRQLNDFY